MGFLDDLLGAATRRQEYGDFVKRYEQGHPSEGYSDQEVLDRYREVSHAVPPDQYAQAAQEALARLSPEERAGFAKMLQERAQARGVSVPSSVPSDPRDLSQILRDLHQTPGRLTDLLGGRTGAPSQPSSSQPPSAESSVAGMLNSPIAKAALAGIAAMVVRRAMNR